MSAAERRIACHPPPARLGRHTRAAYRATVTDDVLAPNAARFAPLEPEKLARWADFPGVEPTIFPVVIGLRLEEVRADYARMRLPYRPELQQPAGVVHGGALATLIDTVVVPAVGSAYEERMALFTISMTINFIGGVVAEDAVAEGWVEHRGRTTLFCRAEVRTAGRGLAASASLVYTVRPSRA
ncbi:MAG: thioesterase superfamily protein [Acidimicrobiales bacterium]|nr:thioesterase superfamily protein [Acidimicrobiales bacterium]